MSEQQKAPSFEQALEELESLVNELEHGELPLEKSLEKFEKAIQLARTSQQQLQQHPQNCRNAAEQRTQRHEKQQGCDGQQQIQHNHGGQSEAWTLLDKNLTSWKYCLIVPTLDTWREASGDLCFWLGLWQLQPWLLLSRFQSKWAA